MKVFVCDLSRCNGCYSCQIVCKDEHCGRDWLGFTKAQPDTGQFWMKINEKTRGKVPVVRVAYVPTLCAHCDPAPCANACTAGAFRRMEDGMLLLDPDLCVGCFACVDACPIHAIYPNSDLGIAQKCTGCEHLLQDGFKEPRCVDACATGALQFGEKEDFADVLANAETLPGIDPAKSHVFYMHLPKRFIAGCLVDFDADEVIIGANVSLLDESGKCVRTCRTDEFGDFLFDQVAPHAYTVVVELENGAIKKLAADTTQDDVVFGDIEE